MDKDENQAPLAVFLCVLGTRTVMYLDDVN